MKMRGTMTMRMRAVVGFLACFVFLSPNTDIGPFKSSSILSSAYPITLDLIHTNQVYGVLLGADASGGECTMDVYLASHGGGCLGGAARQVSYVSNARSQWDRTNPNITRPILVDSGNFWWGSLWYYTLPRQSYFPLSQQISNILNYDAMGLGTADFYNAPSTEATYIDGLTSTIVNCNLDCSLEPTMKSTSSGQSKYTKWKVVEAANTALHPSFKVGIVSVVNSNVGYLASPQPCATNGTTSANAITFAIAKMKQVYPDVKAVILLSEESSSTNLQLAYQLLDVNVIVEGLGNLQTSTSKTLPYPRITLNALGRSTYIVSSGSKSQYIGRLKLTVDNTTLEVLAASGDSYALTNTTVSDDPVVSGMIANAWPQLQAIRNTVIGRTVSDILGGNSMTDPWSCRNSDCMLGRLSSQALYWRCGDCDVAFMNGGALFGSIIYNPAVDGNITMASLSSIASFSDSMVTFYILGSHLLEAIQNGINMQSLLHATGMRYIINPSLPTYQRLTDVQIWNTNTKQWEVLYSSKAYKITTSSFLLNGGGGHVALQTNAYNANTFLPLLSIVYQQYITSQTAQGLALNISTRELMFPCVNTTFTLTVDPKTSQFIYPDCHIVKSLSTQNIDIRHACPTNKDMCTGATPRQIYPGMYVNTSTCAYCSGLGTCDSPPTCVCGVSSTGEFAGMQMLRPGANNDCTEVRTEFVISDGIRGFLNAIAAVTVLVAITCSSFYFKYRDHRAIRAASPIFLHLMNFGAILGSGSVFVNVQKPISSNTCMTSYWLLCLAFGVIFGALCAKTYRLYRIFGQRTLKVVSFYDSEVAAIVCVVLGVEITVLACFQAMSPLQVSVSMLPPDITGWMYTRVCSSEKGLVFTYVLILVNAALLTWGIFLSFSIRDIDSNYNESKYLGLAIYNTAIACVVSIPVILSFANQNPLLWLVLQNVAIVYCCVSIMLIMCIPKMLSIQSSLREKMVRNSFVYDPSANGNNANSQSNKGISSSNPESSLHLTGMCEGGDAFNRKQLLAEIMTLTENERGKYIDKRLIDLEKLREELQTLKKSCKRSSRRGIRAIATTGISGKNNSRPSVQNQVQRYSGIAANDVNLTVKDLANSSVTYTSNASILAKQNSVSNPVMELASVTSLSDRAAVPPPSIANRSSLVPVFPPASTSRQIDRLHPPISEHDHPHPPHSHHHRAGSDPVGGPQLPENHSRSPSGSPTPELVSAPADGEGSSDKILDASNDSAVGVVSMDDMSPHSRPPVKRGSGSGASNLFGGGSSRVKIHMSQPNNGMELP